MQSSEGNYSNESHTSHENIYIYNSKHITTDVSKSGYNLNQELELESLREIHKNVKIQKITLEDEINKLLDMYSRIFTEDRINTSIFEEKEIKGILKKYNLVEKFQTISSKINNFYIENHGRSTKEDGNISNNKKNSDEEKNKSIDEDSNFKSNINEKTKITTKEEISSYSKKEIEITRKIKAIQDMNDFELGLIDKCEQDKTALRKEFSENSIKLIDFESKVSILNQKINDCEIESDKNKKILKKCMTLKQKEISKEVESIKEELEIKIKKIKDLEINIVNLEKQLFNKSEEVNSYKSTKTEIIKKEKLIKDYKIQIDLVNKKISTQDHSLNECRENLESTKKTLELKIIDFDMINNQYNSLKTLIKETKMKEESEISKIKSSYESYEKSYIEKISTLESKGKNCEKEKLSLESQIDKYKLDIMDLKEKIKNESKSKNTNQTKSNFQETSTTTKIVTKKIQEININNKKIEKKDNSEISNMSRNEISEALREKSSTITRIKEELEIRKENFKILEEKYKKCSSNFEEKHKEICDWKMKYDNLNSSNEFLSLRVTKLQRLLEENQKTTIEMKETFTRSSSNDEFKIKYETCVSDKELLNLTIVNLQNDKKVYDITSIIGFFKSLEPTDEVCSSWDDFKKLYENKCPTISK